MAIVGHARRSVPCSAHREVVERKSSARPTPLGSCAGSPSLQSNTHQSRKNKRWDISPGAPPGEVAVKSIHAVGQKVTSPQVSARSTLPGVRLFAHEQSVCGVFMSGSVESCIEEKAINVVGRTLAHVLV